MLAFGLDRNSPEFISSYLEKLERKKRRIEKYKSTDKKYILVVVDPPNLIKATRLSDIDGYEAVTIDRLSIGPPSGETSGIIVFTNNVISKIASRGELFIKIRLLWQNFIFICHDYDNHHWYPMSKLSAEFSDFYFPAHPCGFGWTEEFPSYTKTFVPCGSIQWSKETLIRFIQDEIFCKRSDEPLGGHTRYPRFGYRNTIIEKFAQQYHEIRFVNTEQFHMLTEEQKLDSWKHSKVHLIAPVNSDVPIRFFDALITGGLPIVPTELVASLQYFGVPPDFYTSFAIAELDNPKRVIERALEKYEQQGALGILSRAMFALEKFHVLGLVKEMVNKVNNEMTQFCETSP